MEQDSNPQPLSWWTNTEPFCQTDPEEHTEEMNDIMKIVKPLKESGLSIKGVSEPIKNEAKEKKEDF